MREKPFIVEVFAETVRPLVAVEGPPPGKEAHVWLRELLEHNPSLLPVEQLSDEFAPLIAVGCGVLTGSGELDNLLVSARGRPTLVMIDAPRPQGANQPVEALLEHGRQIARWNCERFRQNAGLLGGATEDSGAFAARLTSALEQAGTSLAQFEAALAANLAQANFLLLVVGEHISPETHQRVKELQSAWGLGLTLALIELPFFRSKAERADCLFTFPRIVGYEPEALLLRTMLDAAMRVLERDRERPLDARIVAPPIAVPIESVSLATFADPQSCREFHERLRAENIRWRTRINRRHAEVFVSDRDELKARKLLHEHCAKHPDPRATGFQITYDYPIFGAMIAGAFGMILLAVDFRHPFDLIRPALLMLLGGLVGWIVERARTSFHATGSCQLSFADCLVASGAMIAAAVVFLGGLGIR